MVSSIGALNGWTLMMGQVPMAAAADGLFPAVFGRLSPRGVPAVGLVISAALATALVLVQVSGGSGFAAIYNLIVSLSTMAAVIPYAFCALAPGLIAGRSRQARCRASRWSRSSRSSFAMFTVYGCGPEPVLYGLVLLLLGLPVYVWQRRENAASVDTAAGAQRRRWRRTDSCGRLGPRSSMKSGAIRCCGCWSSCPPCSSDRQLEPDAHTLLFVLSVLAIVPLAALLSHATESVAAKTGDSVGGLLNATLGNLTELIIALAALRAGQYTLVKASIAGAVVTNTLFLLGASFLLGGLKHHVQDYNRINARMQASLLFLATIALLIPSTVSGADSGSAAAFTRTLSVGLSVLLIVAYGLGMLFSLKTHRELFGSEEHVESEEAVWPIGLALATLAGVTVLVALTSEVFVESVQEAAAAFGMTPAFVGFIVVPLVGAAAEMASAFSGARKNRLDLSVGIALGSASQIALFVAPVLVLLSYAIGPTPMDLQFWPGVVVMMLIATLTASLVTNSGRSAWFVGVLVLMVYLIFAMTLYLLPPRA